MNAERWASKISESIDPGDLSNPWGRLKYRVASWLYARADRKAQECAICGSTDPSVEWPDDDPMDPLHCWNREFHKEGNDDASE